MLAACLTGCEQPGNPGASDNPGDTAKPEVTIIEGMMTDEEVEFYISAVNADEIAYLCVETNPDEIKVYKPETLFTQGEVFSATTDPVPHVVSGLKAETEYTVYAAAVKGDETAATYSEVKELKVTTSPLPKMLEFVSASKTGFSYKVNVEEGQSYFHTYIEGWYFEWQYESAKLADGDEFDASVFVWNMLAEHGLFAESSQTIEWYAGQEDEATGNIAYLVPGIKYYALAALWDETNEMWNLDEKPEVISFMMEEPGESDKTISCSVESVSPTSVSLRMECDETQVNFFMYDLYPLAQYKAYVSEHGIEGMMDYVSEYGYPKANTYTDTWMVDPGKSYMLCVYGVDYNGDEFYNELPVSVPLPEAEMTLTLVPYERELNNYNTYNTLRAYAYLENFIDLDYSSSLFYLAEGPVTRVAFDAAVAAAGLSGNLEELQADAEAMSALGQSALGMVDMSDDTEALAQLNERGTFEKIYTGLEADTEYVYMLIAEYDGAKMCRLVSAKTDPKPQDIEESEQYQAYLGNWELKGMGTDDWTTYHTYNLRFERLTSNRSYKVYGWSTQKVGEDFPFEAAFDPATGKISIATPQVLGTIELEGKTYEVHFAGKAWEYGDELIVLPDYEGIAFIGSISGSNLIMLAEIFQYAGQYKDFYSMSYVLYDPATREYYNLEPYDLIEFRTTRSANQ